MMNTLDERREALEARIWELFPQLAKKKRPPNLVIDKDYLWGGKNVNERFQELTSEQAIEVFENETHWMSDVDYIHFCFPSKTFLYYLPAFLIALMHVPEHYPYYSLRWFWEDLNQESERFTHKQDELLIAIFEWLVDYLQAIESDVFGFVMADADTFETFAIEWMLVVDKKKAELGQRYLR